MDRIDGVKFAEWIAAVLNEQGLASAAHVPGDAQIVEAAVEYHPLTGGVLVHLDNGQAFMMPVTEVHPRP